MIARLFVFLSLAAVLAFAARSAGAASFRPSATVDGDRVTLGDVFDDAGEAARQIVARAPAPGRRMVFDAHALAALAQAYGIAWRPASPYDRTVVERSAIVIGGDRVESLVADALAGKGAVRPFAILFDRRANRISLPADAGELSVDSLSYDATQRRFSGTLTAPSPDGPIAIPVSGATTAIVELPILNRSLNAGEIVGVADLDLVPMPADRIAPDTILHPQDIVGRVADRPLQPRNPLRAHDFKRDLLVKRGQTVTMMIDTPNLSLTTTGRALTDGAKGEPVRVLNVASSRVVEGRASGAGLVTVSDNTQQTSSTDTQSRRE